MIFLDNLSICHACRGFGSSAQVISLASHGAPPDFTIHPSTCRGGSRTALVPCPPKEVPNVFRPRGACVDFEPFHKAPNQAVTGLGFQACLPSTVYRILFSASLRLCGKDSNSPHLRYNPP